MTETVHIQPASWVEKTTRIRVLVGEFCLAHVRFRAATLRGLDWRNPIDIPDEAIQTHLKSGAEVVYLTSLPAAEHLPRLCFRKGWFRYVTAQAGRHYIEITGTFQEYLNRFGGKTRNTLARRVRKFAELNGGSVDFREYRSVEELPSFYEAASKVTVKTYQFKLLGSGLQQTDEFRNNIRELARTNRFRGYILFVGGSPVAFAYCSIQNGILSYQCPGYDPEFQQYSPGTVLLWHILSAVFSEGCFDIFDFGTGEASYKSFFGTAVAPFAVVYHFAYRPKNLLFLMLHFATWAISTGIVRVLSAMGIKDPVKKAIRRAF